MRPRTKKPLGPSAAETQRPGNVSVEHGVGGLQGVVRWCSGTDGSPARMALLGKGASLAAPHVHASGKISAENAIVWLASDM